MKYIGMLLTVVAGIGLGLYYSERLTRRVNFLKQSERLLEILQQRLLYTVRPLATLWQELADGDVLGELSLLTDTVKELERLPFGEAFAAALERAVEEAALMPEDRQLLLEFGWGCGRTDVAGQQAHIRAYREQLSLAREAAEREASSRGQVYRMMGVAGGVGLALLML